MSSDDRTGAAASAASPRAWRDRVVGEDVQHDPDVIRREPGLWGRLFGDDIYKDEADVCGQTAQEGGTVVSMRVLDSEVADAPPPGRGGGAG